jgi:hypothetical protein
MDMFSANHDAMFSIAIFALPPPPGNVQKKSKSQKENRGAAFMELDEL